jgi:phosphoribosylformylglycinamidine synthase
MKFLHHGLPQRKMIGKSVRQRVQEKLPRVPKDLGRIWQQVMAHGDVCSKEPIVRMYDHNVQGKCALHPFGGAEYDGPNDAVVVKPLLGKPYGLVISHGLNPVLNRIDPYWGSIWALTEAVSNFVAVGGDIKTSALIDNFIWPFPDEESLADLDKSVDACSYFAKALGMSFISGKDSLSSTYRYPDGTVLKIPPVLLISVFGKIPDVSKTTTSDFKLNTSVICLVGDLDVESLGGSAYFAVSGGTSANLPKIPVRKLSKVFRAVHKGIENGAVLACHDISEGGLAATLAEMCIGGSCGAEIDLTNIAKARADLILFSETPGTFVVELENEKTAKKIFSGVPHFIIGETKADGRIKVREGSKKLVDLPIEKLKTAWQRPMKEIFH